MKRVLGILFLLSLVLSVKAQTTNIVMYNTIGVINIDNNGVYISTNTTNCGITIIVGQPTYIPKAIMMYAGSSNDIPTNWFLCDGTHGTPDLRNKFIVGGMTYTNGFWNTTITGSLATNGGSTTHTHSVNDPGHNHTASGSIPNVYPNGSLDPQVNRPTGTDDGSGNVAVTVSVDNATTGISINSATNLPPFFSLAYIEYLPQ